jgi:hypothetical protein
MMRALLQMLMDDRKRQLLSNAYALQRGKGGEVKQKIEDGDVPSVFCVQHFCLRHGCSLLVLLAARARSCCRPPHHDTRHKGATKGKGLCLPGGVACRGTTLDPAS